MPYDKNPPARERFFADRVLPPLPLVLVWPTIVWLCFGPRVSFYPDPENAQ